MLDRCETFGAYTVAVAIVLSVLCCANLALASQTTPPVSNNTAVIGIAPVGNDLSLIDIGGFLRLLGGYLRVGVGASATSSAPPVVEINNLHDGDKPERERRDGHRVELADLVGDP